MICLDVVTLFAPLLIYYKDLIGVTSGALGIVTSQFSCLESVRSPARQTLISKLVGKEPCMRTRSHSTRAANFSLSRDLVSIYRLSVSQNFHRRSRSRRRDVSTQRVCT